MGKIYLSPYQIILGVDKRILRKDIYNVEYPIGYAGIYFLTSGHFAFYISNNFRKLRNIVVSSLDEAKSYLDKYLIENENCMLLDDEQYEKMKLLL